MAQTSYRGTADTDGSDNSPPETEPDWPRTEQRRTNSRPLLYVSLRVCVREFQSSLSLSFSTVITAYSL